MQVWHSHIYNNTRFISTVIKGRSAYRVVISQVDSGTVQNRERGFCVCLMPYTAMIIPSPVHFSL
jgi:hypothetical protein